MYKDHRLVPLPDTLDTLLVGYFIELGFLFDRILLDNSNKLLYKRHRPVPATQTQRIETVNRLLELVQVLELAQMITGLRCTRGQSSMKSILVMKFVGHKQGCE